MEDDEAGRAAYEAELVTAGAVAAAEDAEQRLHDQFFTWYKTQPLPELLARVDPAQAALNAYLAGRESMCMAEAEAMALVLSHEGRIRRLNDALALAETALSDIGDADREPGDDVAWCEARAYKDIHIVRAALAGLGD